MNTSSSHSYDHKFLNKLRDLEAMNFILTTYIYPIADKLELSKRINISLDNPRSNEEIQIIKTYLEKSLNSPKEVYQGDYYANIPVFSTEETKYFVTVESTLLEFESNYSEIDSYVKAFFENNIGTDVLEKLAKMWVIGRFDDEGEYARMAEIQREKIKEGEKGFFMLDKGNPVVDNSDNLISFAHLISLLVNTEGNNYFGSSFFLHNDNFSIQRPKIDRSLNYAVLLFSFGSVSTGVKHEQDIWKSFFHIRDSIANACIKIDSVMDDSNIDKLLFISNLLYVTGEEIKDIRYKLVTLVSLIELILTHSPDHNRFNVEDSISKQFKLKTSILVYLNNKSIDLNSLQIKLRDIYNQRSNIAHGNFKSLDKFLDTELKKSNKHNISKDIVLEGLVSDVYSYLRAIIEEYIKDRNFVDYLKNN